MLKVVLIRHFATKGNLSKKYIGVTDESLCEVGKDKLKHISYPEVDAVFVSPLKRCKETASFIYKDQVPITYDGFRECNFGIFENKNYKDLSDDKDYQAWIDSGGTLPFQQGEDIESFKRRSTNTFSKAIRTSVLANYQSIALIVHGGTIMSILDAYSSPHKDYFHWQVKNGEGYVLEFNDKEDRIMSVTPLSSCAMKE